MSLAEDNDENFLQVKALIPFAGGSQMNTKVRVRHFNWATYSAPNNLAICIFYNDSVVRIFSRI